MKRLSVIVPGYNTPGEWWNRCVLSVLAALGQGDEVVCVDDGSAIQPSELDELSKIDKRVRVIHHEKNMGLPTARNTGLDAIDSEFVAFVDSDDEVRRETFTKTIEALEENNADVAVYGIRSVYPRDGLVIHDTPEDKYFGALTPSDVGYLVKRRLFYYSCNKVFRMKFFNDNKSRFNPQGVPCEDAIFNVGLVVNKAKWVTVAYEGYIYYRYDGSLLSTYKPTYVEGTRACTKAWRDYKDSAPNVREELDKYGLGWYDETSEDDIVRGQWTNIWRRKSPYSLVQKWQYAARHSYVLGKCVPIVFLKQAIFMWLRAHCYLGFIRRRHQLRFLKRIGAKVEVSR